jgi:hypothetical protein
MQRLTSSLNAGDENGDDEPGVKPKLKLASNGLKPAKTTADLPKKEGD